MGYESERANTSKDLGCTLSQGIKGGHITEEMRNKVDRPKDPALFDQLALQIESHVHSMRKIRERLTEANDQIWGAQPQVPTEKNPSDKRMFAGKLGGIADMLNELEAHVVFINEELKRLKNFTG